MTHKKGYFARARFLMTAPSKVRRIADEIRRKPYPQAMALLESLPHKGAKLLRKVVASAAANALFVNKNLDEGSLYIKELLIDDGPRLKRMWPRGRGRADRIQRRMSHISVVVEEIGGAGGRGASGGTEG
jgi:large subunit ribosomal protein L22